MPDYADLFGELDYYIEDSGSCSDDGCLNKDQLVTDIRDADTATDDKIPTELAVSKSLKSVKHKVFSSYAKAQNYASSSQLAYAGEIISVVNPDKSIQVYTLKSSTKGYSLEPISSGSTSGATWNYL